MNVYSSVLNERRRIRDPYAATTTADKMRAQMTTDPAIQFRKKMAKVGAQIDRTNNGGA